MKTEIIEWTIWCGCGHHIQVPYPPVIVADGESHGTLKVTCDECGRDTATWADVDGSFALATFEDDDD